MTAYSTKNMATDDVNIPVCVVVHEAYFVLKTTMFCSYEKAMPFRARAVQIDNELLLGESGR